MPDTKKAFVLMPFSEPINGYYAAIFKPALEAAGYEVTRADDIFTPRPIILDIQEQIVAADLILCEMSGRNPNVFYELGLAHAIGKPAILVSRREEDIPFDLRHMRIIHYDNNDANWSDKLRQDILRSASATNSSLELWPPPLMNQIDASRFAQITPKKEDQARKRIDQMGIPYTQESFLERVRRGDSEAVELFLQSGMPSDVKDGNGRAALLTAIEGKHSEIVRILANDGADVNAIVQRDGKTVLMRSIELGNIDSVQAIIKAGADVNAVTNNGKPALIVTIEIGNYEAMQAIISAGADVNTKVVNGATALMKAVEARRPEAIKTLLAAGADVDAEDNDGRTALMMAVEIQGTRLVQTLLEAKANVNAKDNNGRTALTIARRLTQRNRIMARTGMIHQTNINLEVEELLRDAGATE